MPFCIFDIQIYIHEKFRRSIFVKYSFYTRVRYFVKLQNNILQKSTNSGNVIYDISLEKLLRFLRTSCKPLWANAIKFVV